MAAHEGEITNKIGGSMIDFDSSFYIHNATISDVSICISQCQFYSEVVNNEISEELSKKIVATDKTVQQFLKVIKLSRKKKDKTVTFFLFCTNDFISVFSDFFAIKGAFEFSKSFFDDMDNMIVAYKILNESLYIEVKRLGKIKIELRIELGLEGKPLKKQLSEAIKNVKISTEEERFLISSYEDFCNIHSSNQKERDNLIKKCDSKEEYIL